MVKILKTVDWMDCKDVLLHFAKDKAEQKVSREPTDFCDFFATFPTLMWGEMLKEIAKRLMTEPFDDVTATAVANENSTLFIHGECKETLALDIILNHLMTEIFDLTWRYVDYQKNAVAKFCHSLEGDKVYLFCESHRDASVLHLVDYKERLIAVPVLFMTDFSEARKSADIDFHRFKQGYLRDYLPRDVGDLLSKKKHRPQTGEKTDGVQRSSGIDKGDML